MEEIRVYQTWKTLEYAVWLTQPWRLFLHRPPTHFTYIFEFMLFVQYPGMLMDITHTINIHLRKVYEVQNKINNKVWITDMVLLLSIFIINSMRFKELCVGYKTTLTCLIVFGINTLDEGILIVYESKNFTFNIRYTNVSHYFWVFSTRLLRTFYPIRYGNILFIEGGKFKHIMMYR